MTALLERRIHLLDFANLAGDPAASAEDFRRIWTFYHRYAVAVRPGDRVVAACSGFTARVATFALWGEPIQWRVRNGVGGAAQALVESVDFDQDADRYGTVVIASGSHLFADLAHTARAHGLRTQQVVGRGVSSRALAEACPSRTRLRLDRGAGEVMLAA